MPLLRSFTESVVPSVPGSRALWVFVHNNHGETLGNTSSTRQRVGFEFA